MKVSVDDGGRDGVVRLPSQSSCYTPSQSSCYMLLFIYITIPSPNYAESKLKVIEIIMIFPVTGFAEIEYSFVMK